MPDLLPHLAGLRLQIGRSLLQSLFESQQFGMGERVVLFGHPHQFTRQGHAVADAWPTVALAVVPPFPHAHRVFGLQLEGIAAAAQLADIVKRLVFGQVDVIIVQIDCSRRAGTCPAGTDALAQNMLLQQQLVLRQYRQSGRIGRIVRHHRQTGAFPLPVVTVGKHRLLGCRERCVEGLFDLDGLRLDDQFLFAADHAVCSCLLCGRRPQGGIKIKAVGWIIRFCEWGPQMSGILFCRYSSPRML